MGARLRQRARAVVTFVDWPLRARAGDIRVIRSHQDAGSPRHTHNERRRWHVIAIERQALAHTQAAHQIGF